MIGTQGIQEKKEFKSKFIAPGIHEVKITSITTVEPGGASSPYFMFTFENKEAQTADVKFYYSDAAVKKTMTKIRHMATKITSADEIDAVTGKNYPEYAKNLSRMLVGKWLRIKFTGEEIRGGLKEDGTRKDNWYKAGIGLPTFAEGIAQLPTKLVFDSTNQYDIRRLPTEATESTTYKSNGTTTKKDLQDLPF